MDHHGFVRPSSWPFQPGSSILPLKLRVGKPPEKPPTSDSDIPVMTAIPSLWMGDDVRFECFPADVGGPVLAVLNGNDDDSLACERRSTGPCWLNKQPGKDLTLADLRSESSSLDSGPSAASTLLHVLDDFAGPLEETSATPWWIIGVHSPNSRTSATRGAWPPRSRRYACTTLWSTTVTMHCGSSTRLRSCPTLA